MEEQLKHVGVAYERSDGVKKVTGAAEYVDDIRLGRMLYADVVRSPYALKGALRRPVGGEEGAGRQGRDRRYRL